MGDVACVVIWNASSKLAMGGWLCLQDRWGEDDIIDAVKIGLSKAKDAYRRIPESDFYIPFILYEMIKKRGGKCKDIRVGLLERPFDEEKEGILENINTIGGKDVYSGEAEILLILERDNITIKDYSGNYVETTIKLEDFIK